MRSTPLFSPSRVRSIAVSHSLGHAADRAAPTLRRPCAAGAFHRFHRGTAQSTSVSRKLMGGPDSFFVFPSCFSFLLLVLVFIFLLLGVQPCHFRGAVLHPIRCSVAPTLYQSCTHICAALHPPCSNLHPQFLPLPRKGASDVIVIHSVSTAAALTHPRKGRGRIGDDAGLRHLHIKFVGAARALPLPQQQNRMISRMIQHRLPPQKLLLHIFVTSRNLLRLSRSSHVIPPG